MRSLVPVLVLVVLASVGCDEPQPKQPEGERCSLAHREFDRCVSGLYCRPPVGMEKLFASRAGPVGTCTHYLKEGEHCDREAADCEPGLACERQSGVCRYSSGISREKRGEDIVE